MKRLYILLLAVVLSTAACSNDKKDLGGDNPQSPAGVVPPPVPPGGGTPVPPTYPTGGTADFTIVSNTVLQQYTGRVPNGPSNFKVNIDLHNYGSGSTEAYGGSVKISYQEMNSSSQPIYYQGVFVSGDNATEAKYNKHVTHGLGTWFKGFFEDTMGGVVVVVDQVDDLGLWGGKVFFKNFACGRGPYDPPCNYEKPKRCWFISIGPYDCGAFKTGGLNSDGSWKINTSVRDYPEDYTMLGSFTGMDSTRALNP